MTRRIVVLGAGYSGTMAAKRISRQLKPDQATITLVNGRDAFVERVRLHQLAAGQEIRRPRIADLVAGTGIEPVIGRVTDVDLESRTVSVDEDRTIRYDTLVYALGSGADTVTVPGVAEHTHQLADLASATDFAERVLPSLAHESRVCVVGGGLTGIEAVAELAEEHPDLRISLVSGDVVGPGLSTAGREYVYQTLNRLGVEVREHAKVGEVTATGLRLVDGVEVPADAVLWNTGFTVPELARRIGLEVNAAGRIVVDDTLRTVVDDDVYAVGDSATLPGPGGKELRMACATGIPMAVTAADAIVARARGRKPRKHSFTFMAQNISLGRSDGLFQWVHADDSPRERIITGRRAALLKEGIVRFAALRAQRLNGPYPR